MTTQTHAHRPPLIHFTQADFFRALRLEANRGPAYVRRQAQRMLNRILGPTPRNWAARPPQFPEHPLSPAQRRWFHLHPLPGEPLPSDLFLLEEVDSPEEEDDPL